MKSNVNIAISGMGIVSSLGCGLEATKQNLFAAPPVPALPRRVKTKLELPVFETDYEMKEEPELAGGFTMSLLLLALTEALESAGLTQADLASLRVGVCIGTTVACQLNNVPFYAELRRGGSAPPEALKDYVNGCPGDWVHRHYRLRGPALTVSSACTSGADAIEIGGLWIKQNVCDLVIAGGTDELNRIPLVGFNALGVCSPEPCRPFDANRQGLNLGEAAGVVILESSALLERRGHPTCYSLYGFSKTSDAHHITQPHPEGVGLESALRRVLNDAGLAPSDIAFINAHGTGTPANDQVEAKIFHRLWGEKLKFMSTKAMTGHTLGAAGAIELIFSCLMLGAGRAVKSHGFSLRDPELPVTPLTDHVSIGGEFAISTSLAFGGSNTALLVRRNT